MDNMTWKFITYEQVMKLIAIAHSQIVRIKGKEYAPTSKEIQGRIDLILNDLMPESIKTE